MRSFIDIFRKLFRNPVISVTVTILREQTNSLKCMQFPRVSSYHVPFEARVTTSITLFLVA